MATATASSAESELELDLEPLSGVHDAVPVAEERVATVPFGAGRVAGAREPF
ncbi:hypothetical protein NMG29_17240 [Streptomyces cocklensis]|nr:hypothetical protein [Actinacidiphila cocklensis]